MRRILAAAGVVVLMSSVCYGQEVTPTVAKGTKALLFTFDGLNTLRANNFEGGAGLKYYLSEMTAVRGSLQLSKAHQTIPPGAPVVAPNTSIDGSADDTTIGIAVALERHLRTARVSPYMGVGGGFSTRSTESTLAVVGNPPGPQQVTKNANGGTTLGGFGLFGFEFFLTKEVSFAAEYRLGFSKTSAKDQQVTLGAVTTTTPGGSSSSLGIASSGLFTLAVYF